VTNQRVLIARMPDRTYLGNKYSRFHIISLYSCDILDIGINLRVRADGSYIIRGRIQSLKFYSSFDFDLYTISIRACASLDREIAIGIGRGTFAGRCALFGAFFCGATVEDVQANKSCSLTGDEGEGQDLPGILEHN
jgi:hypothetical protein